MISRRTLLTHAKVAQECLDTAPVGVCPLRIAIGIERRRSVHASLGRQSQDFVLAGERIGNLSHLLLLARSHGDIDRDVDAPRRARGWRP